MNVQMVAAEKLAQCPSVISLPQFILSFLNLDKKRIQTGSEKSRWTVKFFCIHFVKENSIEFFYNFRKCLMYYWMKINWRMLVNI